MSYKFCKHKIVDKTCKLCRCVKVLKNLTSESKKFRLFADQKIASLESRLEAAVKLAKGLKLCSSCNEHNELVELANEVLGEK